MLQKTLTCEGHANLHKVTFGYRSPQVRCMVTRLLKNGWKDLCF